MKKRQQVETSQATLTSFFSKKPKLNQEPSQLNSNQDELFSQINQTGEIQHIQNQQQQSVNTNSQQKIQKFDYFVVYDFEATCDQNKLFSPQELIEFSAVIVDAKTLEITEQFQKYVRPTVKPLLTPFCVELTKIQQWDVDNAQLLQDVLQEHMQWLKNCGLLLDKSSKVQNLKNTDEINTNISPTSQIQNEIIQINEKSERFNIVSEIEQKRYDNEQLPVNINSKNLNADRIQLQQNFEQSEKNFEITEKNQKYQVNHENISEQLSQVKSVQTFDQQMQIGDIKSQQEISQKFEQIEQNTLQSQNISDQNQILDKSTQQNQIIGNVNISQDYQEKLELSQQHVQKSVKFAPVSWTDWDFKIQLHQECDWREIQKPQIFNQWIDLKKEYKRFFGQSYSLKVSVEKAGLEWEGNRHSGIADAKNTARLLIKLCQQGLVLDITGKFDQYQINKQTSKQLKLGFEVAGQRGKQQQKQVKNKNGDFMCGCGSKAVLRTVKKPGVNNGRQFYSCGNFTMTSGSRCNFFVWKEGG